MATANLKAIYRSLVPIPVRRAVYQLRRRAAALAGGRREEAQAAQPVAARTEGRARRMTQEDILVRYLNGIALHSYRLRQLFAEQPPPPYGVILAHEAFISGLTALRIAEQHPGSRLLLDNVEYPRISGRSSQARESAKRDMLGDRLLSAFVAQIANEFDQLFATSRGQADVLREIGVTRPVSLLRNMRLRARLSRDDQIRRDAGCLEGQTLLLYPNNVYELGGAEECLQALHRLPAEFHLAFLGEVQKGLEARVDALLKTYGLVERVKFLKPVQPDRLIGYISGADVSIVPLRPEIANHQHCLPNRIFESIAAGVPLVVPSGSEIGAFVQAHGVGVTFPDFEADSVAETLLRAVNGRRAGAFDEAIETAQRDLVWENEQTVLQEALRPVLETGPRRCLVVACKRIERNDRLFRITHTLRSMGFEVDVAAYSRPYQGLVLDGVNYLLIPRE
ncbi:MAG: glycosyltransferase [Gammaproteobacteria bacterium]|nr:glycosyltransferase [Gammaproteobacteria bacterium]